MRGIFDAHRRRLDIREDRNLLTKIAPTSWGNAGAEGTIKMIGNGVISWEVIQRIDFASSVGLSYENTANDRASIDYCINTNDQGDLKVFESGIKTDGPIYNIGDIIAIQRIGFKIYYMKNGYVFHESSKDVTSNELVVDCAMNHIGSKILNTRLNENLVVWKNIVGCDYTKN